MRKVLMLVVALGLIGTATFAQNYNNGYGNDYGNGPCGQNMMRGGHMGYGHMGNGNNIGWNDQSIVVKSEEDAKAAVTKFISDAQLKGYSVGEVQVLSMNNGLSTYFVSATDGSKNEVEFRVWPTGAVRGPIFKFMYNSENK